MEKLTYQEFILLLEEFKEDLLDGDFDQESIEETVGAFEKVDSGGFDSESYYSSVRVFRVFHFIDHDIFVKLEGYISSYEGLEFEKMFRVYPTQKSITIYEP